ncbi:hypothetical protein [Mycoplasmopsis gallinacea]|uniref:Uncharacterized protein n=1 Tax=Mycoplasmopsis gallinacea TaxID=29556 RepID=A0A6H0V6B9_9BACT|nr:hypothetical protein [Mycoplasmopsis gallinacea]QIW62523.1 hypothetical protein GOQ20_03835 [Mycoplasmopsis gallinacea]
MTYEQISKVLGISLQDYNQKNNSLTGDFKVSKLLAKISGTEDENTNFKKLVSNIFETCDALINQKASIIFERLEFNTEHITELISPKRVELLRSCIYNEIAFRISTNQYPENINSVNLLSSSVNVYGDVRTFGIADSFLNPVAQRILVNSDFENIETDINEYLNNISVVGKQEFTQKISELSTYINSLNEERKQSILKLHALLQHERNLWTDAINQNTFDLNRRLVMVELPLMNIQSVLNNQKETTENIKSDLESTKSTLLSVETKQREQITQGLENVKNDLLEKQRVINEAQGAAISNLKTKQTEIDEKLKKIPYNDINFTHWFKQTLSDIDETYEIINQSIDESSTIEELKQKDQELENALERKVEYDSIQEIQSNFAQIQSRMNELESREPSGTGNTSQNPQIEANTNEIARVATNLGKTNKRVQTLENLNLSEELKAIKFDLKSLYEFVVKFVFKGHIMHADQIDYPNSFDENEAQTWSDEPHFNWEAKGLTNDN